MSQQFEFIEEKHGIASYQLKSNGLKVLLQKDETAPVVGFQITYHVGSRHEATGYTGATHLLEHLMFKGSKNFNKQLGNNIDRMENVGAQLNATTWGDRTNYYMVLPKEHLPQIVAIEADRMRGAFINEEDRQLEMTVVRNEFEQGENDPSGALYKHILATVFQAHPYHHDTIGWRSDIENVSIERLKQFYHDFYWPDNATLTVVGDFEDEQVLSLIDQHFGKIQSSGKQNIGHIYTQEPKQEGERRFILKRPAPGQSGMVAMAWPVPAGLKSDHLNLRVMASVLGEGKSSRLSRALVDQGLALSVYVYDFPSFDPGLMTIFVTLAPGVTHQAVEKVVIDVIEAAKSSGILDEELQRVRRSVKVSHAFRQDSIGSRLSGLNEAIAIGDWKYEADFVERFCSVSASDCLQALKAYVHEDACTVGYFIPQGE
ncbi:insulinase family protein [Gammaproteobacteria bacterium]|nr:insulinase family protein [Gammaproteobacteria bacterium]